MSDPRFGIIAAVAVRGRHPFRQEASMRSAFALFLGLAIVALPAGSALGDVGDVYVSADFLNLTTIFDGVSGALIGPFATSVMGGGQLGIAFGGPYDRVLIGHFSNGVDEFDAGTGAYVKTYNPVSGDTQWSGIYAPDGNVYIGSWFTDDVRKYDSTTGAYISTLTAVTDPADMRIGPDGNLYVCSYTASYVREVDATTGALLSQIDQPPGYRTNDVAFLPSGDILVTASHLMFRYDSAHNFIATYAGTGWLRPHGIDISPWDGNIYVADGVTQQVHVFDSATFVELTAAFLTPAPSSKISDVIFRPETPVSTEPSTWGRIKTLGVRP